MRLLETFSGISFCHLFRNPNADITSVDEFYGKISEKTNGKQYELFRAET